MAYGTVNADVIGTSVANTSLGAGNASIMKNRIINGAMVVSQYNGTSSVTPTTDPTYVIDRWKAGLSQVSKYSVQQNAGSVTPPVGFSNYLGVTSLSAYSVVSTDNFYLQQCIEGFNTADLGWGTANAKTVTFSFQVYSSLTGTFGGSLTNSAASRSYPFSYSIPVANTWTTISVTIAGDTTGTWIGATNGIGIRVFFSLGAGSNFSGTAGAWNGNFNTSATGAVSVVGTNGATFYITGVQLEVGSSTTGFEYVNYQTSLANCQRYYFKGQVLAATTSSAQSICLPVPMRASPTISVLSLSSGTGATYSSTGGTYPNALSMIYQAIGNSAAAIAVIETSGTEL